MLSESFYLKLAITCNNMFPFAPVVRLVIFSLTMANVYLKNGQKKGANFCMRRLQFVEVVHHAPEISACTNTPIFQPEILFYPRAQLFQCT